ncbi:protein MRG1 isoform X1 [Momordica charantia]|uniref:Protein MRG1 isoform X1 n=1 Tax=Momordica charantia TaxID=3673 RepID=A0A6J1BU27_MOMCH|nr:protein MRG1 isoform X1 [Momordica charantia]
MAVPALFRTHQSATGLVSGCFARYLSVFKNGKLLKGRYSHRRRHVQRRFSAVQFQPLLRRREGPCLSRSSHLRSQGYDFTFQVQRVELRKKEWRYFLHYLGWNKNWDEWVSVDRLMKCTDENRSKQQALEKGYAEKSSKSGRSAQAKPKNSTDARVEKEDHKNNVSKGKKRKNDSGIKDNQSVEKVIKIQIPSTLRKQLVDDWEFVTQQDKLVKLPRTPTVDDILTKYLEFRSKRDGTITDSLGEVLKGIRCYFDKALPVLLLYNKEREQYHELVVDNVSPSTIYGAEHLLRLFVKLPELLAYVNIEDETQTRLHQKLLDFLKFLQKNQSTFFVSAYDGCKGTEGKGKGKND